MGQTGWEQLLEDNRRLYLEDFVSRSDFVTQFPLGQLAGDYVDSLFQNAGVAPSQGERSAAIAAYGSGNAVGRAAALRSVVESSSFYNAQLTVLSC